MIHNTMLSPTQQKTFLQKCKAYIRKLVSQVIAPNCVLPQTRILLYRLSGYKIGKRVFIGMRCYLDDLEPQMFIVEDDVTISYGCYFACHGRNQGHTTIVIKRNAYLGMRSNVVSGKRGVCIGENAVVGACSLVISDVEANTTVIGIPAKIKKQL